MSLNISTLTPANLKAKQVATEDYVDNVISAVPNTDEEWQIKIQHALDADETVINGSKITTGSIDAARVNTGTLNSNVINGLKIVGNSIEGAQITGSVIRSSWIDYSTSGDLTDWAYFTPATVPPAYAANFAVNNTTGTLVTDSNGFVRLSGIKKLYSIPSSVTATQPTDLVGTTTTRAFDLSDDIHSYDDYTHVTGRRVINARNKIKVDTDSVLFKITARNQVGMTVYGTMTCYIGNSLVSMSATVTCTSTANAYGATVIGYYSSTFNISVNGVNTTLNNGTSFTVEGFTIAVYSPPQLSATNIVPEGHATFTVVAESQPRLMDTDYTGQLPSVFRNFTVSCGPSLWHDAFYLYEYYVPAGYDYPACTIGIPQFYIDKDV